MFWIVVIAWVALSLANTVAGRRDNYKLAEWTSNGMWWTSGIFDWYGNPLLTSSYRCGKM